MIRMYEGLTTELRYIVDQSWKAISDKLKEAGYGADNADPAEKLVDAITDYVLNSNQSFRTVTYAAAAHYEATVEYTKGCGP